MADDDFGCATFWMKVCGKSGHSGRYVVVAERVIRVPEQVTAWRGQPQAIRLDKGPEFLTDLVASWCADRGIALRSIQPGKPIQNAFIERFNLTDRHEILDASVFVLLD
jgi:putative transposase